MAVAQKIKKVSEVVHPLAHLIPPAIKSSDYVSRKVRGILDTTLLEYARQANRNVMLFGPTGPGKTSLVSAYAAQNGIPMATINCHGSVDPDTFWGSVVDTGSGPRWVNSDVLDVMTSDAGVVLLDEVNFLPAKVAAALHPALDGRRTVSVLDLGNRQFKVGDGVLFVCAYNPDYEGTRPLNAAFKNRFAIKIEWTYDPNVEKVLVCMPILLTIANQLRAQLDDGTLETPVSTNMLIEFEDFCLDLSLDFAIENFIAAFNSDERDAIALAFTANRENISAQVVEMSKDI